MSGRNASRITQLGTGVRVRARNSRADAKDSACQPAAWISILSDWRTEISASTTKTIGAGSCDMGKDLLHRVRELKGNSVDLRIAEDGEINSAEMTDDERDLMAGSFTAAGSIALQRIHCGSS